MEKGLEDDFLHKEDKERERRERVSTSQGGEKRSVDHSFGGEFPHVYLH